MKNEKVLPIVEQRRIRQWWMWKRQGNNSEKEMAEGLEITMQLKDIAEEKRNL
ncbi:MAG: hypothetical protein HFH41_09800 [Lachnospiraceae bacterium]|nr:hypothetical protein [Lachnospiraceae bacterium]